jgi:hypothetical protein
MTLTLSTFKATRGYLQAYGDASAVLKVGVYDETVIDNEDELVVKITDLSSEVTGGTYAATTLTGVAWDLTGDLPALRADDVTIEGLDLPGPSPLPRYYVVYVDDHDDTDRIDDLVAVLEATPAVVVGDQPITWPGGIVATLEAGDQGTVSTVATVAPVAGDIDAQDLADQLHDLLGIPDSLAAMTSDVDIPSPVDGNVLVFDGSLWKAVAALPGSDGAYVLTVTITAGTPAYTWEPA